MSSSARAAGGSLAGLSRHRGRAQQEALTVERPRELEHPTGKVAEYDFQRKLGQGTFGIVYKGAHKKDRRLVAIKHVLCRLQDKNLSITTLREITVLKVLKHENIIQLIDIISDTKNEYLDSHIKNPSIYRLNDVLCMVFPYMSYDLTGILQNRAIELTEPDKTSIMYQMFQGIDYIHQNKYIHRDIKASNILINQNGLLKIGDFGLVRRYHGPTPTVYKQGGAVAPLTEVVMTRWYRAPEVLFGNRNYGTAVDIWGIGCVMGELYTKVPILKGETDIDQGIKIFELCGSPNDSMVKFNEWKTKNGIHPQKIQKNGNIYERFEGMMSKEGVSLLSGLLEVDPDKRFTTTRALEHEWFHIEPVPPRIDANFPECHEADAIRQNQLDKSKRKSQPYSAPISKHTDNIYNQTKTLPYGQQPLAPVSKLQVNPERKPSPPVPLSNVPVRPYPQNSYPTSQKMALLAHVPSSLDYSGQDGYLQNQSRRPGPTIVSRANRNPQSSDFDEKESLGPRRPYSGRENGSKPPYGQRYNDMNTYYPTRGDPGANPNNYGVAQRLNRPKTNFIDVGRQPNDQPTRSPSHLPLGGREPSSNVVSDRASGNSVFDYNSPDGKRNSPSASNYPRRNPRYSNTPTKDESGYPFNPRDDYNKNAYTGRGSRNYRDDYTGHFNHRAPTQAQTRTEKESSRNGGSDEALTTRIRSNSGLPGKMDRAVYNSPLSQPPFRDDYKEAEQSEFPAYGNERGLGYVQRDSRGKSNSEHSDEHVDKKQKPDY